MLSDSAIALTAQHGVPSAAQGKPMGAPARSPQPGSAACDSQLRLSGPSLALQAAAGAASTSPASCDAHSLIFRSSRSGRYGRRGIAAAAAPEPAADTPASAQHPTNSSSNSTTKTSSTGSTGISPGAPPSSSHTSRSYSDEELLAMPLERMVQEAAELRDQAHRHITFSPKVRPTKDSLEMKRSHDIVAIYDHHHMAHRPSHGATRASSHSSMAHGCSLHGPLTCRFSFRSRACAATRAGKQGLGILGRCKTRATCVRGRSAARKGPPSAQAVLISCPSVWSTAKAYRYACRLPWAEHPAP